MNVCRLHRRSYLFNVNLVDYIVFSRITKGMKPSPNADEVSELKWINRHELSTLVTEGNVSPWFRLLYNSGQLGQWWTECNSILASPPNHLSSFASTPIVKMEE